jgi:hypothetical protein
LLTVFTASAAAWMSSPASAATACTPNSLPLSASAMFLMKPRVSKLTSARYVVEREQATIGLDV